jgi:hypothetical protein
MAGQQLKPRCKNIAKKTNEFLINWSKKKGHTFKSMTLLNKYKKAFIFVEPLEALPFFLLFQDLIQCHRFQVCHQHQHQHLI